MVSGAMFLIGAVTVAVLVIAVIRAYVNELSDLPPGM